MEENSTNQEKHDKHKFHITAIWIVLFLGILVLIIVGIYFYFKIHSILIPRMMNPKDFVKKPLTIERKIKSILHINDGLQIRRIQNVEITYYNNTKEQTDSSPNITASNRLVYEGSCAISRDFHKWLINFGDWVYIERLNEYFVVEDLMAEKHKRRLDIFVFKENLIKLDDIDGIKRQNLSKKDLEKITGKSDIYLITIEKKKK